MSAAKILHHLSPSSAERLWNRVTEAICQAKNHEGEIQYSNHKFKKWFGEIQDLKGLSQKTSQGPEEELKDDFKKTFTLKMLDHEGVYEDVSIPMATQKGEEGLFEIKVIKESEGIFVIFKNVTSKRLLEKELTQKHQELFQSVLRLELLNEELKTAQESLVQAGKLAALGELAAGVAHELNQPLQAILGFAQEIEFAQSEDQRREFVGEIQKSARKMSKIIHQLRVFSRKSKEENDWVDLKFVIDETRKLLESQFRSQNITFVVNTHKVKDPVFANALQLEQVLVNFSTNARDAIRAAKREQGKIEITIFDRGPSYVLSFKDNGCGMSPSVKEKAMNPFFTTKEVGHGTGLGLSLSYTLIQKMGGHIDIQTQEGVGTEMILTLPKDYRNSQRRAL